MPTIESPPFGDVRRGRIWDYAIKPRLSALGKKPLARFFTVVVFLVAMWKLVVIAADWTSPTSEALAVNGTRLALLQMLATAGVAGGLYFTSRTVLLTSRSHVATYLSDACKNLSASSTAEQIGALLALAALIKQEPSLQPAVHSLVSAYLRDTRNIKIVHQGLGDEHPQCPWETRYAMELIGSSKIRARGITSLDLRGICLSKAPLQEMFLEASDFTGSCFYEGNLVDAHLRGAKLTSADLRGASLASADLRGATLKGAKLDERTSFHQARVDSASFEGCSSARSHQFSERQLSVMKFRPTEI